jgi:hypothetical protein
VSGGKQGAGNGPILENYRQVMLQSGFSEDKVNIKLV